MQISPGLLLTAAGRTYEGEYSALVLHANGSFCVYKVMNHNKHSQARILEHRLQQATDRYAVAIQDENYIDAKAIMHAINQLQIEMDNLLPYVMKENKTTPGAHSAAIIRIDCEQNK